MVLEHLASRVENLMTVKVWLEWLLSFSELRLLDTKKKDEAVHYIIFCVFVPL